MADGRTPCEKRFHATFNGPIWPCGSEILDNPREDKSRLHQFGKKNVGWHCQRQRRAHGRWMNKRLAHRKLRRTSQSEVHVERFKSSTRVWECAHSHVQTDRSNKRDTSHLPNNAGGDSVAEKFYLRHVKPPSVKLQRTRTMSAARCHLPSPRCTSRSAMRAQPTIVSDTSEE